MTDLRLMALSTIFQTCLSHLPEKGRKKSRMGYMKKRPQPSDLLQVRQNLFVLRFCCPVNPMEVISSVVSLPNTFTTFTLFARNWQLPFLNQQKGENDRIKYSMINLHEKMLPTRQRSNPQPPDHQSDAHPTESLRLASKAKSLLPEANDGRANPLKVSAGGSHT